MPSTVKQRSAAATFLLLILAGAVQAAAPATQPAGPADLAAGIKWQAGSAGAQATFEVGDLDAIAAVQVVPGRNKGNPNIKLNGKGFAVPLAGIEYGSFPIDPQTYLVKGQNVLTASAAANLQLQVIPPAAADFILGPMLGAIAGDYFTAACRTNVPGVVTVTAKTDAGKEISASSARGFYHRFKIALPEGTKSFTYTAALKSGAATKSTAPREVAIPGAPGNPLHFIAAGDSRTNSRVWASAAAAILKAKPQFMIHTGDFAKFGHTDHAWGREFFNPARDLLASVPIYGVPGNHDDNSPIFFEMFYAPSDGGKSNKWHQQIGDVLLIGMETGAKGDPTPWLKPILEASKAKFIFVFTHYPAWSSGMHGKEIHTHVSRNVVMPLLAQYHATAMIGAHDHDYERNEPAADKGVMCIVSGGLGAPTRPMDGTSASRNPYSKKFVEALHYCLIDVEGDKCTLKAIDLEGKIIDEIAFKPRQTK